MLARRNDKAAALALFAAMLMAAAVACTHDFDVYEGTSDPDASSDAGPSDGPSRDGAASSPEAAADASCVIAQVCGSTATSCKASCDDTQTACNGKCGGSNSCRGRCKFERDKCVQDCTITCRTCAGSACLSACN
jgi:hypothetical protein